MTFDPLTDPVALEEALDADAFLILKHSERCGISRQAFREVERFLREQPDIDAAWIDVRGHRALSDRVTEATGVAHASPQAFWIRDGRVAWHASHFDITAEDLASVLSAGL